MADVKVDHEKISKLGDKFAGWGTDIRNAGAGVYNLSFQAGTFAEATTLANTITRRGQELQTNLDNLGIAFQSMAVTLHNAAIGYQGTEGENAAKADFNTFGTGLDKTLSGLDKGTQ